MALTRTKREIVPPALTDRLILWNRGAAARFATGIALAVVLFAVLSYSLKRLDDWGTELSRRQSTRIRIQWADVPEWLRQPENQHVFDSLMVHAGLTPEDHVADRDLTQRVCEALGDPRIGWVRSVKRVIARPPDVLQIHCEYREPVAWIVQGPHAYLVDEESVRLPGQYAGSAPGSSGLVEIRGVRGEPPAPGETWPGDDMAAALKIAGMVDHQAFSSQITAVDVENFAARITRTRPHIELQTDRASRICWGRAPGDEDATETSAEQKVALLEAIYRKWGRVDMNRAYIDITTWSNKVALPAAGDPDEGVPLLRG